MKGGRLPLMALAALSALVFHLTQYIIVLLLRSGQQVNGVVNQIGLGNVFEVGSGLLPLKPGLLHRTTPFMLNIRQISLRRRVQAVGKTLQRAARPSTYVLLIFPSGLHALAPPHAG